MGLKFQVSLISGCALAMFCAASASASVTVIGGGFAEDCSRAARAVADRSAPLDGAISGCTRALEDEPLSMRDLAGTYVNRGVLYLAAADYGSAQRDFDSAVRIEPQLGEAWVNRGAALIGMGRDADGVVDIDKGLGLSSSEPEKAYFNRAIAKERLDDVKGAYFDYQKALELKPGWEMPQRELARFHVEQR